MRNLVLYDDCLVRLKELPAACVQTCVTSPPYYGLRDYADDRQIGLEETPQEYVAKLVTVFREVRRVLRDDGTLWLNLGDSYANDGKWGGSTSGKHAAALHGENVGRGRRYTGLKPKDLIGIPWRVAFALQDDGWYLRSDIIWAKGNAMPESVTDRPTKSHEYVFLLSKNQDYFYDQDAIREPFEGGYSLDVLSKSEGSGHELERPEGDNFNKASRRDTGQTTPRTRAERAALLNPNGRNKRTVWNINPKPYKGAHFAVFPAELPALCIKAGSSEKGCCSRCGAPWHRVLERTRIISEREVVVSAGRKELHGPTYSRHKSAIAGGQSLVGFSSQHKGWEPSCNCGDREVVPCLVLDPFAGSGTTLEVAKNLDRDFLGIELNEKYRPLIERRVEPAMHTARQREIIQFMMDLETPM